MEIKQKQEPIKTTCFLKGEAGLLFFLLSVWCCCYLSPCIDSTHRSSSHATLFVTIFFFPPVKAKLLIWCSVKEKKPSSDFIYFFLGNQLLNYKSRWCLTLTQSRGRSCEEIHQRLISKKKKKKYSQVSVGFLLWSSGWIIDRKHPHLVSLYKHSGLDKHLSRGVVWTSA